VSGKERKDMAQILLGCIIGKAPSQVSPSDAIPLPISYMT